MLGHRFGRLVVDREDGYYPAAPNSKYRHKGDKAYVCICDCGNEIRLRKHALVSDRGTRSCGCLRKETSPKNFKRGVSLSPRAQEQAEVVQIDLSRGNRREAWYMDAACADDPNPDAWFPLMLHASDRYSASTRHARATCNTCPVKNDCVAYAITEGLDFGIWGGATPAERRRLRTQIVGHHRKPVETNVLNLGKVER